MRISGEHAFTAPRERVWAALQDPRTLANAIPGARRLEVVADDEYALTVAVGVGSVKGTYEGTFRLEDKVDGEACTVRAGASGGPGSVEAVARMTLRDGEQGALLSYEADANVTGALAGVGQRLVAGAARRSTREFLQALEREIAAPTPAGTEGAAAPGTGRVITPPRPARADPVVIAVSALAGFVLALIGVGVGRWTARR